MRLLQQMKNLLRNDENIKICFASDSYRMTGFEENC